jgi:WD40 repeat protein
VPCAVSRSLTGHRSNCLSLAFTTSDTNCLISGSQDCTVKVWDLRRKEAITTYKGHNNSSVLKVAPSPDNKWVCSGSEDGELKVGPSCTKQQSRSALLDCAFRPCCLEAAVHACAVLAYAPSALPVAQPLPSLTVTSHLLHASLRALICLCACACCQVWDLSSGKVIKDGWRHNGRITGLEFNQVSVFSLPPGLAVF